jgi:hypothetical protein
MVAVPPVEPVVLDEPVLLPAVPVVTPAEPLRNHSRRRFVLWLEAVTATRLQ